MRKALPKKAAFYFALAVFQIQPVMRCVQVFKLQGIDARNPEGFPDSP